MPLLIVLSVLGLAVLAFAADQLVLGSGRLAERLGLEPVVVGVVVIGFGTSAPELVVAGTAGLQGQAELAASSLVGSNIINLTLILGVGGLTATLAVRSSVLRREAPLSVADVTIFAITLLYGLSLAAGVVLAVALIGAVVVLLRSPAPLPVTWSPRRPRTTWTPPYGRAWQLKCHARSPLWSGRCWARTCS
ncbi:hypothetical protein [Nonomuraea sp. NPDC050786]|uniref:hypothetical protein n=1 Tax=Nonomuraea sp. NPDC050786 TaxID=3154840 RepID=UPI0033DA2189